MSILDLGHDVVKLSTLPISSRTRLGTNIFSRDWDLLIVLDTCRVDAMKAVAPEYEFIESVDSIWSVGSATAEWVANTFVPEYTAGIEQTTYVASHGACSWIFEGGLEAGSPFNLDWLPRSILDRLCQWEYVSKEQFGYFDTLWKHARDNELAGTTRPETVSDRVIELGRDRSPDQMIAHYKQPHAPHVANAYAEGREPTEIELDPFNHLDSGEVWENYLDELRWGLDNIETVLKNYDAERVVLTADHGELFGNVLHSHPIGLPHPKVRRVPWVVTEAEDTQTHTPDSVSEGETKDLESQLEHLGYL